MNKTLYNVGYWSGLSAFTFTIAFDLAQTLQLFGVLIYPWDEILIYGFSFGIVFPLIIEMLALHYSAPAAKRFWSHAALIFTVMYAVFVTMNYVVQLATVIPMTIKGRADEIVVLQQTPHSLFWNFDAIGYICMGLSTIFAMQVFEKTGLERWVKYSLLAHALTTPLIAIVYFYPVFSNNLFILGLPWGITAPAFMLAIAIMFKRKMRELQFNA